MSKIRLRIAPSPTGPLHIGTIRTALFNYLYARHQGGVFVVRIEDTDKKRSTKEFETQILQGFYDLGLVPDEDPLKGGEFGPYRQTERLKIYRPYLDKLLEQNGAYYCFCTKEELEAERQVREQNKLPPRYSGKCCGLSAEEKNKYMKAGRTAVIRFRVPAGQAVTYDDLIRGAVTVQSKEFDDFVIAKDLDTPLYNFANVIDDSLQEITHVIRGEDHISNTPKQIMLYQALGLPLPKFGHLPLILNEDRSKLSKRQNKVEFHQYLAQGYLPEAILNFLALLGWNPGTPSTHRSGQAEQEIFTLEELIKVFDLDRVQKAGAIFNIEKLDWLNGQWIRILPVETLAEKLRFFLADKLNLSDEALFHRVVTVTQDRLKFLSEAHDLMWFFFQEPDYEVELLIGKKMDATMAKLGLESALSTLSSLEDWSGGSNDKAGFKKVEEEILKPALTTLIEKLGLKTGQVLWPIRAALSGQQFSPGAFEMLWALGKRDSVRRIKVALGKLG